jgi:hypothetical protein
MWCEVFNWFLEKKLPAAGRNQAALQPPFDSRHVSVPTDPKETAQLSFASAQSIDWFCSGFGSAIYFREDPKKTLIAVRGKTGTGRAASPLG